jgi:cytochrome P450
MPYALKPLQSDPPDHAKFRRILDPAFTKQKMEAWNPKIHEIARDLISAFKDKGHCEFISEFAQYLPNRIFMAMAGLPDDRFDEFMEWEKALLHGADPAARLWGMQSIENFVADHFLGRRGQPRRDDLTDVIAHAEIDGQRLSDEDIKSVGFLIYIAGLDTVQAMTGFAFLHLATHPGDQMAMRESDQARARGLEEILRLHGIVASGRTAVEDMEFKGVQMKAGDRILTFAGFGNRDPIKFSRGATPDVAAKLNPHLTFGAGPHLCLGMHLARNELNISMDEMFKALPPFSLQQPAVTRAGGVCGVDELHLTW